MAKKSGSKANDLLIGGDGGDQLKGNDGDDLLDGGAGNDSLYGGKGRDDLRGGDGHDQLRGNDGDDVLHGDAGDDGLWGNDGNDELYGGAGNDDLYGNDGDDLLDGGDGDDRLHGGDGRDRLEGGAGNDRLDGNDGDDLLLGGAGHDYITGGDGDDLLDGGAGNDELYGGKGRDDLRGGDGNDQLRGNDGNDVLHGDAGDDGLWGNDGNDELYGGAGNDDLYGNDGDDLLDGGDGDDQLHGGDGRDRLEGGAGNDRLDGNDGDDLLLGGAGHDYITGGDGDDLLDGGAGNDELYGGKGRDDLRGGDGDDQLRGNDGNDELYGGAGNDDLYGNDGDDLFVYRTGDGNDEIDGGNGNGDTIRLEVDDGWVLSLSKGRIASDEGGQLQFNGSAAGTIKLADGSIIRFKNIERIETAAGKPDDSPPPPDLDLQAGPIDENAPAGSMVGTVVASEPGARLAATSDALSYRLIDDADGRFAIDAQTGVITVADGARLDYESAAQHEITVEVTDAAGLGTTRGFTIEVADVNEAPEGLALSGGEVAEGAAAGTVVGTAAATDPDAGDTLTYALNDDAGGRFAIDAHSGVITVADGAVLDRESAAQHEITVEVTDAAGLGTTRSFTIEVANVNEAPGGIDLDAGAVAEDAAAGTVVGSVTAADPDAGDTLTYALTDDAGGRFAIDAHSGVISVADGALLDHESAAQHEITVEVTDAGGLSASASFTIEVAGANETPGGIDLDAGAVAEDAAAGTVVGSVAATDPDAGDTLTYALTDDAGGRFAIDAQTGVITVADGALLDHESAAQHEITVEVTDAGGLSTSRTFAIEVADVNEAPGGIDLDAGAVAEDAAAGTVVGTAAATDPDAGDTLTYSLTDDAGGRFAIDAQTGVITVADGAVFEHDAAAQHGIEVTVTDAGGLRATRAFTIAITQANEAPGGLDLGAAGVAEGAPEGTVVGTVSASDPNAGDTLTYSLTDDAGGRFAIDPQSGVVTVAAGAVLDFESGAQHAITVQVTDAAGLSASRTFTIAIADVNEAPEGLALDGGEVAEDAAAGTVVGTVAATDPDAGDTLTYALTDDAGGCFAIDPQSGVVTLADGAVLDRESTPQHEITVEVTDAGGLSVSRTFAIGVGDVNEAPGGLALSGGEVAENAAAGTVVGSVAATDPDAGDTLTYALTDDAGGRFAIDAQTGVITVAAGAALDHESASQHGIEVTVTDAGGLGTTRAFTIDVADVNEAPDAPSLDAASVAEGAGQGTVVGTVTAGDPDGDTPTYALSDDAGGRFAIDAQTGVISVAGGAALDHEAAAQHEITVEVSDSGGLKATRSFTIAVTDVNEAPGSMALSGGEVAEDAAVGAVVGTVAAADPDAGDTLTYALTDDAGGRFAIDAQTGVISVADGASFDYEAAAQHEITVEVTDAGGLGTTRTFAIGVVDVNEAPGVPSLDAASVAEGAGAGTVVGTVVAADPDAGDTHSYSLTDDAGGRFVIDPQTGVITVAAGAVVDFESAAQHEITVEVTDAGGLKATRSFAIAVTDVNEAPGSIDLDAGALAENAGEGTVVGTVSAGDPDAGDTLTYALSDDAGGRFAIDPQTGVITVAAGAVLDFEGAAQHGIEVTVTDAGGLGATRSFTIEVGDVNEAPEGLALSGGEVSEAAAAGTVVGAAAATDPDAGDTLTYALSDDAGGRFAIDPQTGVITVAEGAALDHDAAAQHGIEVTVTDTGGLGTTRSFTIEVLAEKQAPTIVGLSAAEVAENAGEGTVVGTVAASDPDPGDVLTFALSDDAGGRFAIDAQTGVITVADGAALDHESAAEHAITVEVTDADGLATSRSFTIAIADVNEAPSIAGLGAATVAENAAAGTVVGTVAAADPDAGDTLTYALSDDAGGRFAIDPHTGVITVAAGAALDFEAAMQHGVEVEVTDAGGLGATRTFSIAVTNVNEQPVVQALSSNQVVEGAADGTVIGTVSALDPDGDAGLTYALSDDAGGRFAIDAHTGVITVADGDLLDFDQATQHGIEVTVTDPGGLSQVASYLIELLKDNSGDDVLTGGAGDDLLDGGPGDDILDGGAGDDHLIGGPGDDSLTGGLGNDWLEGGDGNDFLFGNNQDDRLFGGAGDDQLFGGNGNDVLDGGDGNDQLLGNAGNDLMDGGAGDDELTGSLGDDVLFGGAGDDALFGGLGNDVLVGGPGNDRLSGDDTGSFGADRFVFTSPDDGVDEILDFGAVDVLGIGGMLSGFVAGDEASFVRLIDGGSGTTVQVDVDGTANGEAFQSIAVLTGVHLSLEDMVSAGQIDFWMS